MMAVYRGLSTLFPTETVNQEQNIHPDSAAEAMVLFSGGQDSTVCLAWALNTFSRVHTIGFDYGQRHAIELECRQQVLSNIEGIHQHWSGRLGDDQLIDMSFIKSLGETAMTTEAAIKYDATGLPNTFVPGRNVFFFTTAAAVAYRLDVHNLVGGMCETDYSGYPDCRDQSIQQLAKALSLSMDNELTIHTPLMWIDKAATWSMAHDIGNQKLIDLVIEHTHTCYIGDRTTLHDWGYGCNECPACELRANGYASWRQGQSNA